MNGDYTYLYSKLFNGLYKEINDDYKTQEYINKILKIGFVENKTNTNKIRSLLPNQVNKETVSYATQLINEFDYCTSLKKTKKKITPLNIGSLIEDVLTDVGIHEKSSDGAFFTPQHHIDFMCRESLIHIINIKTDLTEQEVRDGIYDDDNIDTQSSEKIIPVLETLTVVDPSCGAGDFLIGMVNVISDIKNRLSKNNNIKPEDVVFGADTNNASVSMARFRLGLVSSKDNTCTERKFVVGDSVLQEVNRTFIPTSFSNGLPPELYQHYTEHKNTKKIITDYINESCNVQTHQQTLAGTITGNTNENKTEENKTEWVKNENGFFWPTAFPSIMEDGGFDIVIGNPPYVSKEDIYDPNSIYDSLEYRKRLQKYTEEKFSVKTARNSDLYVYFFFKSIELLNENGVAAYVTSNSWLDCKYGHQLRHGLLKHTNVNLVLDTDFDIFKNANINSVTTIVSKNKNNTVQNKTKFAHLSTKPLSDNYNNIISSEKTTNVEYIDETLNVYSNNHGRIVECNQELLWKQGTENTDTLQKRNYDRGKWSLFLQAPSVFYEILKNKSVTPLEKHTDITLGTKTGANGFFYLPNSHHKIVNDDDTILTIENIQSKSKYCFPKEYINEILTGIETTENPITTVDKKNTKYILTIPSQIENDDICEYIKWAESHNPETCDLCPQKRKKKFSCSPSWSNHSSMEWYDIKNHLKQSKLIVRETIDKRFGATLFDESVVIDGTLYGITPSKDVCWSKDEYKAMTAILNSSLSLLLFELYGRSSYGSGALQVRVFEYNQVPLPNIKSLPQETVKKLADAVSTIERGQTPYVESIIDSGSVSCYNSIPTEQRTIDEVVMRDILGLSNKQQLKVYNSIEKLVSSRIK